MYVVAAVIMSDPIGGWLSSGRQVPTFYLNDATSGILDEEGAKRIARDIIDPFGTAYAVHITAVRI